MSYRMQWRHPLRRGDRAITRKSPYRRARCKVATIGRSRVDTASQNICHMHAYFCAKEASVPGTAGALEAGEEVRDFLSASSTAACIRAILASFSCQKL